MHHKGSSISLHHLSQPEFSAKHLCGRWLTLASAQNAPGVGRRLSCTVLCKSNANDNRWISRYITRIYLKQYIERYIVRAIVLFLDEKSFPVSNISFPLCDISFWLRNISFLLCDISFPLSEISFQFIVLALWNTCTHTLLQKPFTIMTYPLHF